MRPRFPEPRTTTSSPLTSFLLLRFLPDLCALAGRLVERHSHVRPALVLARLRADVVRLDRLADEVLERVAVPLLERRALGLAVVGEDDDVVRTRRVAEGAHDAAELLIELAQRLEGVRALEPEWWATSS